MHRSFILGGSWFREAQVHIIDRIDGGTVSGAVVGLLLHPDAVVTATGFGCSDSDRDSFCSLARYFSFCPQSGGQIWAQSCYDAASRALAQRMHNCIVHHFIAR